jgi:DNA segregation ATPase FtsK/SpoIIIE-like protein
MYDHAVAIVTETQQASISMVQRRLRWDITALVIEHMER